MVGNALEEGLIGQRDNPSHTDIGRISVPAGGVVGLLTWFMLVGLVPDIGGALPVALAVAFGGWVAWRTHKALHDRATGRAASALQAARDAADAETRRRIAAMNESGTR